MSHNKNLEKLAAAYQELLKKELKPYLKDEDKPIDTENFKKYILKDKDINDICTKYNADCNELKSYLTEIEYDHNGVKEKGYHTSHFDLIYRIVNIRNLSFQPPIPLEYRIEVDEEPVPDFGKYKLANIQRDVNIENDVLEPIINALGENDFGISTFQREVILKILTTSSTKNDQPIGIGIIAPTSSGKTLSFLIPLLINALKRTKEGKNEVSALLIYPRKALEIDQLRTILKIVDKLNEMLNKEKENNGKILITIGIDDGDAPKSGDKVKDGDPFRGLKCPRCNNGNLIYSKNNNKVIIRCNHCHAEYDYILGTKEDIQKKRPSILISNIHTVYRRLMNRDTVKLYSNLDYVILDEAHVYTDYLGGFVRYILIMLKQVSKLSKLEGYSNPLFVFSSATIPNPEGFLNELFGGKVEVIKYSDVYKNVKTEYNRLIIRLYLLPNPQRSIETLYQAIALAVTLWAHKYRQKVISFIDSVAEIATLKAYIKKVILGSRQGREILDHVDVKDPYARDPLNDYSWITIAPDSLFNTALDDSNIQFLTGQFKDGIETHHGRLSPDKRSKIESAFKQDKIRHLIATSTLELGIDIADVAVIVQYKLPIAPEGVIQRIGRAGRDPKSFRTALGVILLPSTPIGTLYMYDEDLRRRFATIEANKPYKVGYDSENIKLQMLLSFVLFKRAIDGKETYISGIRDLGDAKKAIGEILEDLDNKDTNDFISKLGLSELIDKKEELRELLQHIYDGINYYMDGVSTSKNINIDEIIDTIKDHRDKIAETLKLISNAEKEMKSLDIDIHSFKSKFVYCEREKTQEMDLITFLGRTLDKAHELLSSLISEIERAIMSSKSLDIDNWVKQKKVEIDCLKKNLNQINIFNKKDNKLELRIKEIWAEVFNMVLNMGLTDKVIHIMSPILQGIEDEDKKSSLSQSIVFLTGVGKANSNLDTLYAILDSLKKVDIGTHYIIENIKYLEEALIKFKYNSNNEKKYSFNIFEIINKLYNNRVKFSLMLQPPFPEIEETETEVKDNE